MSRKRPIKKVKSSQELYRNAGQQNNKIFITPKLEPKTPAQKEYIDMMSKKEILFCGGPAGTGKSYCSVAYGLLCVLGGYYEKLILIRPAITSEEIGLLPGDISEKVGPFMEPVMNIVDKFLSPEQFAKMQKEGKIEVRSLAYLRGLTLDNSFIIIDESENCNKKQLMLIVTRIGNNSKLIVEGDETQSDLKRGDTLAFARHLDIFEDYCEQIGTFRFTEDDIVRNKIIGVYLKAIKEKYETNSFDTEKRK
mgnify:CR=1 FL=1